MNDAGHDWTPEQLAEYIAGGLTDDERADLEAHSQTCVDCAAGLAESSPNEPIEPVLLRERFKDRMLRSLRFGKSARPRSGVSTGLLAGAAVVLLGLVGMLFAEIQSDNPGNAVAGEALLAIGAPESSPVVIASPGCRAMEIERPREIFERTVFFPEGKVSNDNEDYHQMKGESNEVLSYIKGDTGGSRGRLAGKAAGAHETLAVGSGGGGGSYYGSRMGGRDDSTQHAARPISDPDAPGFFKPSEAAAEARARQALQSQRRREADRVASTTVPSKVRDPQSQEEGPKQQRRIIRSGEMEFEIDSFDSSVMTLTKITIEEQGYVATVNSEKLQNGKVRGLVVVRVPPEHLDTLLLKLRALGDLKSQRIGSEDVTKHYTDLESRLRAARTMEERLFAVIKGGKGEIKDLLMAEKELGEWRTKIETMVGEINYYNNLIAHSTLTITLSEKEIRAPFGLVDTERVEMGVEVEDVEKAHRDALAAVAEAKGRVTKSELKQLAAGQFNAIIHFEIAPDRAGVLRDRIKQLGSVARLDINRTQETLGGSGKPQDLKVQQNDTQVFLSIYNLANIAPRETVRLSLACVDAEKSYRDVQARVEKAAGRVLSSNLTRQKSDQTTGVLQFQIKAVDADAVLQDVRAAGEVMKLEVIEDPDTANATRSKRGFSVSFYGLGTVQPRETTTITIAARDVAAGYRTLLEAVKAADGRVLAAQLNENDRKNMTATLSLEVRREHEPAIAEAMAKAGGVYTRQSTRAQDSDIVVDSKVLLNLRLFDPANIPPRETVKLSVEVNDVEAAARGLEAEFRGRVADARHTRESSGRRESTLTIDVPLKELSTAVERIKALGSVRDHVATKTASVPDNDLAVARLEVQVSNEILLAHDSGPWANIRRGLAFSLQAGSWALMLIIIGICFVLPLVLAVWAGVRIHRKLRPKVVAATPAA